MQIDWLTVIAQVVNFLILVWLLKRFLYQPVITAMAKREERIGARLSEAQQREGEAEAERRRFREKSESLERSREQKLAEAREAAEREKRIQLDEARHEIDRQRDRWRDEIRREQDELRKELRRELGEAAVGIARRALADMADTTLEREIVETFMRQWERLSDEERASFAQTCEPLRLVTAFELDESTHQRLRSILQARSGIEFARDPGLVCGIALTGDGHRLDWNIQDYLDEAEQRVRKRLAASTTEVTEHA